MKIDDLHSQTVESETAQPSLRVRPRYARALEFLNENGVTVLLLRGLGRAIRVPRDALLAHRLKTHRFRVGRNPRILGLSHMKVGSGFAAGNSLWLEAVTRYEAHRFRPSITIGDNVGIGDNVHIGCTASVSIGNDVLIGSRVTIIDHNHGIYGGAEQSSPASAPSKRSLSTGPAVSVGEKVWIGDGAVVLPGSRIGKGSVIGANAVVSGAIPEGCIAVGCPARPIRIYDSQSGRWVEC